MSTSSTEGLPSSTFTKGLTSGNPFIVEISASMVSQNADDISQVTLMQLMQLANILLNGDTEQIEGADTDTSGTKWWAKMAEAFGIVIACVAVGTVISVLFDMICPEASELDGMFEKDALKVADKLVGDLEGGAGEALDSAAGEAGETVGEASGDVAKVGEHSEGEKAGSDDHLESDEGVNANENGPGASGESSSASSMQNDENDVLNETNEAERANQQENVKEGGHDNKSWTQKFREKLPEKKGKAKSAIKGALGGGVAGLPLAVALTNSTNTMKVDKEQNLFTQQMGTYNNEAEALNNFQSELQSYNSNLSSIEQSLENLVNMAAQGFAATSTVSAGA